MFSITLKLYFVLFDDIANKFKIYIDDSGNIPEIELQEEGEIEDYIFEKSLDLFYGSTENLLNSLKLTDFLCFTSNSLDVSKEVFIFLSIA